jgi:hypothetical protein
MSHHADHHYSHCETITATSSADERTAAYTQRILEQTHLLEEKLTKLVDKEITLTDWALFLIIWYVAIMLVFGVAGTVIYRQLVMKQ